ncbi:MAG: peptidylprolyl isomerase [Deltaproteobacteria bacterium]|jgi:cyclophilin family peptidyl-prolyl cis-trans isomerase|nr:peptidylprolyl isomerase [Deltaproteobacteria bacterium]
MRYLAIIVSCLILFMASGASAQEAPATPKRTVAVFETTMGTFKAELYDDLAPHTTANFEKLVQKKFYDGTIFHRIIDGFMIQGGDPTGSGRGGPGYKIGDEFGEGLLHDSPGILSMANSGPNTGGSQFFITLAPTKWLNGKHAIFGKVLSGMDVVQAIGKVATNSSDRPLVDVKIERLYLE